MKRAFSIYQWLYNSEIKWMLETSKALQVIYTRSDNYGRKFVNIDARILCTWLEEENTHRTCKEAMDALRS